jgi:hypothetical protein
MHEQALRTILLIQAVEESDTQGELLPRAERAQATQYVVHGDADAHDAFAGDALSRAARRTRMSARAYARPSPMSSSPWLAVPGRPMGCLPSRSSRVCSWPCSTAAATSISWDLPCSGSSRGMSWRTRGNEATEAFGAEGHVGDLASTQTATRSERCAGSDDVEADPPSKRGRL